MINRQKTLGLLCSIAAFALSTATPLLAAEKVSFLLNWVPQGDHSPYYYAQKMGWYTQDGIDLTIEGGRGSASTIQRVGSGQVALGIADMTNILPARSQNIDVVGVMAIYSKTAYGLYWKLSSGIKTPKDLAGRKIGAPAGDAVKQMWPAIAKAIGIPAESVTWVNIAPEAKVASLKSGVIDFTQHFYTVHDVYEQAFGEDLGFVGLRSLGVNPYGLSIMANGAYLKTNPDTVRKFLRVTQRAFKACIETPVPCTTALAEATSQKPDDVLANWKRAEFLISDDYGREAKLGAFDPARMTNDAKFIEENFKIAISNPQAAYSNEFLDASIKLPADK